MKKRLLFFAVIALVLVYQKHERRARVTPASASSTIQPEAKAPAPKREAKTDETTKKMRARLPASTASPLPFEEELTEFERLNRKVLLTDQEIEERQALIKNAAALKGLANRLIQPALNDRDKEEQNAVLDLELEALKKGDQQAARQALSQVVGDTQIEKHDLPPAARQNLAGLKAEVLFQWSALQPGDAQKISKILPGPVSQRIWRNVAALQSQDLAISAAPAAAH